MNCVYTMLGIDAISKDQLQKLVSREGYFDTVQAGMDLKDYFGPDIDESRHTCILDVDHTLLFVRYFGDEMAVDDRVHFQGKPARVQSMIYEIQVREEMDDNPSEFRTASYRAQIQHQEAPVKGSLFTYIVENEEEQRNTPEVNSNNQAIRQSVVINAEAVGCEVECQNGSIIQISFEDDSPALFALKPDMNRPTHAPVELLHDGFLVRLRPGLAEFLNTLNKHFNVILFTAAEKDVYQGLLARVHSKLINSIPTDELINDHLWSRVLYRDSCDMRRIGPNTYHIKNLSKFGLDMGRIVIVDNNPGSFRGFEPNAICCGDYHGVKATEDDVLLGEVMPILDKIVNSQTTDVRYVLCDLPLEMWSGDSPREDSRCEEEIAGFPSSTTPSEVSCLDDEFGNTLQTTVQSRRHSFHAGSMAELSREIQTDRTIQFLRCLRNCLSTNCRIDDHNGNEFQDAIMRKFSSYSCEAGSATTISRGPNLGCAGSSLSALLKNSRDTFVETDSETESIRTMVINDEDSDIVMMESGAVASSPSPRSDENTKFIGRPDGVDSSMSVESHDEDLAIIADTQGNQERAHRSRLCCFCCVSSRERETRML